MENDPTDTLKKSECIAVLIIDGFSNHNWEQTTHCLRSILASEGGFEVTVNTCPIRSEDEDVWKKWAPDFAGYDVIIQTCNDLNQPDVSWPEPAKASFETYVREGGGVYMLHAANNAFEDWEAYNLMIGLGWRKKDFGVALSITDNEEISVIDAGVGENTNHGDRIDALVTRMGSHPLHKGLPKQWRAADIEVYSYARGPAKDLEVISYAREPMYGINFPIEWVVSFGRGRVYNSTYGHLWRDQEWPPGFRCAAFHEILFRALHWLSGHEVDANVPDHFPNTDDVALAKVIL